MKFWIPGPQRAYGTTPRGFQGEIQVVRASDYDLVAHANKVQAEEIHALRKALAQSTILNGSDFVLAYPGCPDCWRVKPEDMPARAAVQQPAPQPAAALVRIKRRMKELWETVPTRADPGSYYLGRSTGTADTLRAIQEEIDRAADQQPTPQPNAGRGLLRSLNAYADHHKDCTAADGGAHCSCGYFDLIERIRAADQQADAP